MSIEIQTGKKNQALRQIAQPVKEITDDVRQLVLDMKDAVEQNPNNIGLAAPQVNRPLRIIAAQAESDKPAIILINPEIIKASKKEVIMEEGCLSLPGYSTPVSRPEKIKVKALDVQAKETKFTAKGLLARIIQHEIDHLNGILICDKTYVQT